MDDFANGEEHPDGAVRLEDVAAHIDAGSALRNRVVSQLESVLFGELLSAGDNDRDGAAVRNALEILVAVVRLNDVGAVFSANAGRKSEVSCVAREILADGGNAERRNTVTLAHIDRLGQVADRAAFVIGIADRSVIRVFYQSVPTEIPLQRK